MPLRSAVKRRCRASSTVNEMRFRVWTCQLAFGSVKTTRTPLAASHWYLPGRSRPDGGKGSPGASVVGGVAVAAAAVARAVVGGLAGRPAGTLAAVQAASTMAAATSSDGGRDRRRCWRSPSTGREAAVAGSMVGGFHAAPAAALSPKRGTWVLVFAGVNL